MQLFNEAELLLAVVRLLGVDRKLQDDVHENWREIRAIEACNWAFEPESELLKWYNAEYSAQLVVFAAQGSGKTIITSHVIEELTNRTHNQSPRPVLCFNYCKTDSTGKVRHIYSSLILQLLDQQESLRERFTEWYDRRKSERVVSPSSADLGVFFSICVDAVGALGRSIFVIIDGLNECDEDSQNKLVTLLNAVSADNSKFKVFFTCQPQKRFKRLLDKATVVEWFPDRHRDAPMIIDMVHQRLNYLDDSSESLEIKKVVIERLSEMTRGCAIWASLTIQLIQARHISKVGSMTRFLNDLSPSAELSEIYARLFTHLTKDEENRRLATYALEILAVAARPLSILELGWAVTLHDPYTSTQTMDELKACVDEERVMRLLQPFISQVKFTDLKSHQVRLVHESLQQLILQADPSSWTQPQAFLKPSKLSKPNIESRKSELEAAMLGLCVAYLLFDEIEKSNLHSDEDDEEIGEDGEDEAAEDNEEIEKYGEDEDEEDITVTLERYALRYNDDTDQDNDSVQTKYSGWHYDSSSRGFGEFFLYASCFWLGHLGAASITSLPDIEDIIMLCAARSKRLENWSGQLGNSDSPFKRDCFYHWKEHDPVDIVANYGPTCLLEKLLSHQAFGNDAFRSELVEKTMREMLPRRDTTRAGILFHHPKTRPNFQSLGFCADVMKDAEQYLAGKPRGLELYTSFFDLVTETFDTSVQEKWSNELLCQAVQFRCRPVVEKLFEEAARNPALKQEILRNPPRVSRGHASHQSVGVAAFKGDVDILHYLLQQDGIEDHLHHRNSRGQNVFHCAVGSDRDPEVISLLIARFQEGVNQLANDLTSPLKTLVASGKPGPGRIKQAKLLLTVGSADVRGGFTGDVGDYREPLRFAVRRGDVEMCRTLVEFGGADPRSALRFDDEGQPHLIDKAHFWPGEMASEMNTVEALVSLLAEATHKQQDLAQ